MNRILKIVGGPLKGAEIALVAGVKAKVGSGDGCDILVADPTLGDVAFELDVTEEEVTLTTPDGAAKTMLDFEVREFGASAFVLGPAEGPWQEIVWPERRGQETGNREQGEEPETAQSEVKAASGETAKPETEAGGPETEGGKFSSRFGCLLSVVLCLLLIAVLGWLLWHYRDDSRVASARERAVALWRGWFPDREAEAARIEAVKPKLADIVAKYALKASEADGRMTLSGNFRTRAERLQATAEAYAAQPGIELDLSDDESLFTATENLLKLVTDGRVSVTAASNRVVTLKGYAATPDALHGILVALDTDVPCVEKADCRGVVCGSGEGAVRDEPLEIPGVPPLPRRPRKSAVTPNLPVCGILTAPYPCLILKNGNRIVEGGEFGGCIIERITSDAVTLRNTSGSFEWRP